MTDRPLLKQSAAALQALCSSCGLKKTGTKAVLVQRLRLAARQFQPLPPAARILSIDLGLKNFAFSLLTPAPLPKSQSQSQSPPPSPFTPPSSHQTSIQPSPVHLHAWRLLDLTLPSPTNPSSPTLTKLEQPQHEEKENGDEEEKEEAFSPAALASLALSLTRTHLLPLRPTHVLIERQRFRTGGASAIFEWTLRVNTLEAMLHAVLAALWRSPVGEGGKRKKEEGDWCWEGRVSSVLPRRVVGFLFPEGVGRGVEGDGGGGVEDGRGGKKEKEKKGPNAKAGYLEVKRAKVDLLAGWLAGGEVVVAKTAQAREMTGLFLEAREGKGRKRGGRKGKEEGDAKVEKKAVAEVVAKMDDLSDSVLQGMVWLQWQRNLEKLVRERPELLED